MIRVLRLMEYEFDSLETAQKHLGQCFVPHDGLTKDMQLRDERFMRMRSTILVTPYSTSPDELAETT